MQIDETLNDYAWEDNCKKSYDLAINELKQKLDAIPKIKIGNCVLYNAPCEEVMPLLERVEAIVTDPPYGLSFMGKSWDYDVPKKEIWEHAYKLLSPGGHLLAFFGSRTYHRGAVQIEDAGFEIRDQIMWVYGSGFPKSHNVSKTIDRNAGAKRTIIGTKVRGDVEKAKSSGSTYASASANRNNKAIFGYGVEEITEPSTEEAKKWNGWGTALKPAHEPIVVARKPLNGTVAENVLNYGCGALNIDGCRVEGKLDGDPQRFKKTDGGSFVQKFSYSPIVRTDGRFPANIIHDGSEEVVELFPNNASRFFYCAKASSSERTEHNIHPTVKPIKLMEYLCKLVGHKTTTILDPFMGSGTTGVACARLGFRFIGIEMNKEYFDIAVKRIQNFYSNINAEQNTLL